MRFLLKGTYKGLGKMVTSEGTGRLFYDRPGSVACEPASGGQTKTIHNSGRQRPPLGNKGARGALLNYKEPAIGR
jgi:hypothetical protein